MITAYLSTLPSERRAAARKSIEAGNTGFLEFAAWLKEAGECLHSEAGLTIVRDNRGLVSIILGGTYGHDLRPCDVAAIFGRSFDDGRYGTWARGVIEAVSARLGFGEARDMPALPDVISARRLAFLKRAYEAARRDGRIKGV